MKNHRGLAKAKIYLSFNKDLLPAQPPAFVAQVFSKKRASKFLLFFLGRKKPLRWPG